MLSANAGFNLATRHFMCLLSRITSLPVEGGHGRSASSSSVPTPSPNDRVTPLGYVSVSSIYKQSPLIALTRATGRRRADSSGPANFPASAVEPFVNYRSAAILRLLRLNWYCLYRFSFPSRVFPKVIIILRAPALLACISKLLSDQFFYIFFLKKLSA